jgi:hypothetical protein
MNHLLKSAGRGVRFRALLVIVATLFGGCDAAERLGSPSDQPGSGPTDAGTAPVSASLAASTFRGGIPFGVFQLPVEQYGTIYNGSLSNIWPAYVLSALEAARRSGTRIMLSMSGSESTFQNSDGSFSMAMWKQRVDRFRGIDFSSYIQDGTLIGHFLMDEPYDRTNWGGTLVSLSDIDAMARYSKGIWPSMPTIIRGKTDYLLGYDYKYLDATWAQYISSFGSVSDYITKSVREAKASGLALVVGVNQLNGGGSGGLVGFYSPEKNAMSAKELEAAGNALLADPYPCAFISWKYDQAYMARADIKAVMGRLSEKARIHGSSSCRAAAPAPTAGLTSGSLLLTLIGRVKDNRYQTTLSWSGATTASVDVYRDGALLTITPNDGTYTNAARYVDPSRAAPTYIYKVCDHGTSRCSSSKTVTFQ